MSGVHVDPDALDAHARQVDAVATAVGSGAAAEVTGTAQADFGVLIGNTLGFGIRALGDHFAEGLQAASSALSSTADQLRGDAANYRGAETTNVRAFGAQRDSM